MDPETIFVIVITAAGIGALAYLELKFRREKPKGAPPPVSTDAPNAEKRERRRR